MGADPAQIVDLASCVTSHIPLKLPSATSTTQHITTLTPRTLGPLKRNSAHPIIANYRPREALTAQISFPELVPGINFIPDRCHPYDSFIAVVGQIPDLHCAHNGYRPENSEDIQNTGPAYYVMPWHPGVGILTGTVEIKLPSFPAGSPFTLMVSVGIRYGAPTEMNKIRQVEHAGSAKVLRVGDRYDMIPSFNYQVGPAGHDPATP